MIRNSAKTSPHSMLAVASRAGIPKTPTAASRAVPRPASAACQAPTRPEASRPSSTSTGKAATAVEAGQFPSGSYC